MGRGEKAETGGQDRMTSLLNGISPGKYLYAFQQDVEVFDFHFTVEGISGKTKQ